jgi:transcriptional regulator with XRE-family HTH domain
VSDDWAAVAKAINERVRELGWRQRELAERSHVSSAIVREIQRHTVERSRSRRTLEALSVALGWPPTYLHAVAGGRSPALAAAEPVTDRDDTVAFRLETLEKQMSAVMQFVGTLKSELETLIENVNPKR